YESRRRPMVLVDEPAEDVSPSDSRATDSFRRGSGIRRLKVEAPVRSRPVVVLGVRTEDALKVTSAEYENVIEALPSNSSDPTLPERVRPRRGPPAARFPAIASSSSSR